MNQVTTNQQYNYQRQLTEPTDNVTPLVLIGLTTASMAVLLVNDTFKRKHHASIH